LRGCASRRGDCFGEQPVPEGLRNRPIGRVRNSTEREHLDRNIQALQSRIKCNIIEQSAQRQRLSKQLNSEWTELTCCHDRAAIACLRLRLCLYLRVLNLRHAVCSCGCSGETLLEREDDALSANLGGLVGGQLLRGRDLRPHDCSSQAACALA
jgi:hypothetical protein